MKIHDKVYVVNWGKHYSDITKWDNESEQRINLFPIKTKIPPTIPPMPKAMVYQKLFFSLGLIRYASLKFNWE